MIIAYNNNNSMNASLNFELCSISNGAFKPLIRNKYTISRRLIVQYR